jgi:ABC-type uncharacterized transport system substrate-binding protein
VTDRREFIRALAGGLLVAPLAGEAQQGKVYKVGMLVPDERLGVQGLRQALRDLGYTEGRNLAIEARNHEGDAGRLSALAADLVNLKVDVIVAASSTEVRAAKQATTVVPIVFVVHYDPVGTGDVASLAHPGGNITGLTAMGTDLTAKQLELLRETVPRIRRLAILRNPTTPSHKLMLPEATNAGRQLGVDMQVHDASTVKEFEHAYEAAARGHADAVLILPSPASSLASARLAELAIKYRLPTMHGLRASVEAGGLMSYAPHFDDLVRRAAAYVDKILKGTKPADIPVEQPTKFELVINLKTAKALGLTFPRSILVRADEVIQ